ncbi:MAG: ParB/RepB/Spo0J family partition protein [Erysipelotrichaceae bacterium]
MSKSRLGKGLDTIFGENLSEAIEDIQKGKVEEFRQTHEIDIESIRPNPYQPRKVFDQAKIDELAQSIAIHGVFQPILVRESVQGYELVAGERRLRASKKAGLTSIPAIIIEFNDEQMMEISLLENIQRENLSVIEEANAYAKLIQNLGYTQEELANRIGKSRTYITNTIRLLKLPASVQKLVQEDQLQMGHVRPLLALDDESQIYDIAMMIIDKAMSVRDVERFVKSLQEEPIKPIEKKKDMNLEYVKDLLQHKLHTKVEVTNKKISIEYHNTTDLNRILDLLNCIEQEQ